MRYFIALMLLSAGCTKPVPLAQDAGPAPLGVVTPDFACPGPNCEDGATVGQLRIGAAKRSIVPSAYELVNTAYLDPRRPEVCDPDVPLLGSGHKHRLVLTPAQQTALRTEGTLSIQTEGSLGHQHDIVITLNEGEISVTPSTSAEHTHDLTVIAPTETPEEQSVWTVAARQPRCGKMRDRFNDFPGTDCGLDGLCEGDDGWPGADSGENDGKPDWFYDCGRDQICPDNVPETGDLATNGLDDDFDGVIDDGPYPGPDEGEDNGQYDGLWQAGFGSNIPSLGIHDPIWARCMAAERGDTSVVICSLDLVGFFWDDVERVRTIVREQMGDNAPDHILISATHVHEAPDSMGQWGPITNVNDVLPRTSGVDPDHIQLIRTQTAEAIRDAMSSLTDAHIKLVTIRTGTEQLIRDTRDPVVIDDTATLLQAINTTNQETIATIFNWGNHPEVLADVNNMVSSDFAHDLRLGLENGLDGGEGRPAVPGLGGLAIYLQGTVGGLMTPLGLEIDDWAGEPTKLRSFKSAKIMGEKLAKMGIEALASDAAELVENAELTVRVKRLDVPIHNTQFHVALLFGLFDRLIHNYDSNALITPGDDRTPMNLPHARTEVNRIVLGPLALLSVPGEIFPEVAVVDSLKAPYPYTPEGSPIVSEGNVNPPDITAGPAGPYLRELTHGIRHTMIVGLGNDELGYIIPNYDFKVDDGAPYFEEAPGDHYEETNSVGPAIMDMVLDALRGMERWLP